MLRCREHKFRLSYYPHRLAEFSATLRGVFGQDAPHQVLADFKPLAGGGTDAPPKPLAGGEMDAPPAYYIHVIHKL